MSALRATSIMRLARSAAVSRASVSATPSRSLSSLRTVAAATPSTLVAAARPSVMALAMQRRGYASGGSLSHTEIETRIFDLLKSFEKVNPSAITAQASFTSDLGLDSLDAVEVVMAIEEEFMIEIPDAEADNITSVQQAIDYISKTPSAT